MVVRQFLQLYCETDVIQKKRNYSNNSIRFYCLLSVNDTIEKKLSITNCIMFKTFHHKLFGFLIKL